MLDPTTTYTLVPSTTEFEAAKPTDLRFHVADQRGAVVRSFQSSHGKELHLIVVRDDLTWYAHLHPVRDESGTWAVPLTLPGPGRYRAFADLTPAGAGSMTLTTDLAVPGPRRPEPAPAVSTTTSVDGYDLQLLLEPTGGGHPVARIVVTRDGAPVTDLEPYLGAFGHLVALRAGDLAYLHVHPLGEPGDGRTQPGPEVAFGLSLPTAGDYRLFFDFQHHGTVRTAAWTVRVTDPGDADGGDHEDRGQHGEHAHGH